MKRYVEFPLEDGSSIVVEVDEAESDYGTMEVGRPSEVAEKAKQSFEHAIDKIKPVADAVLRKLRDLQPDGLEVEFGVKLSAEAGAFLASAASEANFKIKMTWERRPSA